MKTINLKSLLTVSLVAGTSLVLSCGGGGSSSNGYTQNGYYTLNATMTLANPPVYSIISSSSVIPSGTSCSVNNSVTSCTTNNVILISYTIPMDTWNLNLNLAYSGNPSTLSNTYATITSASICFGDPTIPGGQCQPVYLQNYILPLNSSDKESLTLSNNYKLGALGLIANPYQNTPYQNTSSSTIPLNTLSSTTLSNSDSLTLPQNLSPGSVQIGFTATYQVETVNGSTSSITDIYSGDNLVSSSTYTSNISFTTIPSSYTVSGFCIDNGNGGFYPQASPISSSYSITCSGSINYTTGIVSNFSVNLPPSINISSTNSYVNSTISSSTTSSTTIVLSSTTSLLSLSSGYLNQNLNISYAILNGFTIGNSFYAYLPSLPANLYYYLYYLPQYIVVGSNTLHCSQSTCQIIQTPTGYLLQIQNISLSGTSASAILEQYITFNPSITVSTHLPASII
ncbi:MAG: hypothetical protein C0170_01610, partial [Hydrogenobaculum sp.]